MYVLLVPLQALPSGSDKTETNKHIKNKAPNRPQEANRIAHHYDTDNAIQSRTGKIRREKQRELSQTFKLWAISSLILNKTYTQDYDRYACP